MGHVFISYSSRHRDLTRSFAERLEEEGYPVWWDRELEAWGGYEPQIREALGTASAVVVIWSPGAAASDYVRAEVRADLRLGRLINLRAPDFQVDEVPLDFRENHMLPLDIDDMGPILKTLRTVWEGRVPQGQTPAYVTYAEDFGENLFDPRHRALPRDTAMVTPSVLLQAQFEVAEYVDATGILADLMDWCRGFGAHADTPRPTAGRLLHGPGGLGKTRTMIEAVRRLRAEGWLAGFLPTPIIGDLPRAKLRHRALEQAMAATDTPGTMMVLDYAEARGTEVIELARMARRHERAGLPPLRIVLLSRGAGWWQDIYRTEPEIQVVFNRRGAPQGDVIAVEPLPSGECRLAVFDAMRDALKPVLAKQAEAGRFPPLSEQPVAPDRRARLGQDSAYARPLALQMEALLSLGGEDGGAIADLLESILGLERRHWRRVLEGLAPGDRRETAMRRGMSQVTALGGVADQRGLRRLLQADGYFGVRAPVDLPLDDLRRLYGAAPDGVAPLEPDLIGEHEILLSGDEDMIDACRAWIASLPEQDRGPRRRTLLTVLQRAARPDHGVRAAEAEAFLSYLLANLHLEEVPDLIAVAVETPGPLPRLLTDAVPRFPEAVTEAVSQALPRHTVVLAKLADCVAEKCLSRARNRSNEAEIPDGSRLALAEQLHSRGYTLLRLGRLEEALAAAEEAVVILRGLARTRPSETEGTLAKHLTGLGALLIEAGRREDALSTTREACELYRHVAADRPDEFEPALALCLNNLSLALKGLGDQQAALKAIEEAIAIFRRHMAAQPGKLEAQLATSLTTLGIVQKNIGMFEAALVSGEEALSIHRLLTATRPDAFEPDLAGSLNNVAVFLYYLGRHEAAVVATQESASIYRRLATTRPDTYEAALALNLSGLGVHLSNVGQKDVALETHQESVVIHRRLVAAEPDRFEVGLAHSLCNIASVLHDMGLQTDSIAAANEAMQVLGRHYALHPAAHQELMDHIEATLVRAQAAGAHDGDTP